MPCADFVEIVCLHRKQSFVFVSTWVCAEKLIPLLNYRFPTLDKMWEFPSFILIIHPVKTIQKVQMSFLANMNRCWVAKQRGECVEKLSPPDGFLAARPCWPSQLSGEKLWNTGICFTFAPVGKDLNKCSQMPLRYCDWANVAARDIQSQESELCFQPCLLSLLCICLLFPQHVILRLFPASLLISYFLPCSVTVKHNRT